MTTNDVFQFFLNEAAVQSKKYKRIAIDDLCIVIQINSL